MNHNHTGNNPDKCDECGYPTHMHGNEAPCEACPNKADLNPFGKGSKMMLLCPTCIEQEKEILNKQINDPEFKKRYAEYQSPERQAERLDSYNAVVQPYEQLIAEARRIDESVHLSTDIFNAKTIAFKNISDAIYADDKIPADEKRFELARICKERIKHFQNVIFDLDKKKIEAYSEQKSWHVQLNQLANSLRTEERERLKISDITYDVKMPKVVTPRAIKTSPKKASKEEINKLASELNMPAFTIQLLMTSKNWTIEQVGNHLRRSVKEGASMTPKAEPLKPQNEVECECGNKYNVSEGKCGNCGKGVGE